MLFMMIDIVTHVSQITRFMKNGCFIDVVHMDTCLILQEIVIAPNQSLQVKGDHQEPSCIVQVMHLGIHAHNLQYDVTCLVHISVWN